MKIKIKYGIILRIGIILILQSIALLMVMNYYLREEEKAVHVPPPLYKS